MINKKQKKSSAQINISSVKSPKIWTERSDISNDVNKHLLAVKKHVNELINEGNIIISISEYSVMVDELDYTQIFSNIYYK